MVQFTEKKHLKSYSEKKKVKICHNDQEKKHFKKEKAVNTIKDCGRLSQIESKTIRFF